MFLSKIIQHFSPRKIRHITSAVFSLLILMPLFNDKYLMWYALGACLSQYCLFMIYFEISSAKGNSKVILFFTGIVLAILTPLCASISVSGQIKIGAFIVGIFYAATLIFLYRNKIIDS